VVRKSRCGRDDPGSILGVDIYLPIPYVLQCSSGYWRRNRQKTIDRHLPPSRAPGDPTDSIVGQSWRGTPYARPQKEVSWPRFALVSKLDLESSSRASNLAEAFLHTSILNSVLCCVAGFCQARSPMPTIMLLRDLCQGGGTQAWSMVPSRRR
jgi:hypothetical protein